MPTPLMRSNFKYYCFYKIYHDDNEQTQHYLGGTFCYSVSSAYFQLFGRNWLKDKQTELHRIEYKVI